MAKFLELAVELKRTSEIKMTLTQFRGLCQNQNQEEFVKAVKMLIRLSVEKCKQAKEESFKKAEDKEGETIPENTLLKVVSGEDSKDRMDRYFFIFKKDLFYHLGLSFYLILIETFWIF
jgi:hypothetical protein